MSESAHAISSGAPDPAQHHPAQSHPMAQQPNASVQQSHLSAVPAQPHPLAVTAPPTISAFNLGTSHDPNQPSPAPPLTARPPLQVAQLGTAVAAPGAPAPLPAPLPTAPLAAVPMPSSVPVAAPMPAPAAPPTSVASPVEPELANVPHVPLTPQGAPPAVAPEDLKPAWVSEALETALQEAVHAPEPVSPYEQLAAAAAREGIEPGDGDAAADGLVVVHAASGRWFSPATGLVIAMGALAWRLVDAYASTALKDKLAGGAPLDRFDTIVEGLPVVDTIVADALGFVLLAAAGAVLVTGWRRGVRAPLIQLAVAAVALLAVLGPMLAR